MQRKILPILLLLTFLWVSCRKEDRQRNPYLQEAKFSRTINLRLAEYNRLRIPGTAVLVDNVGLRGIVVANIGNNFLAWDRACPSQALAECSQMTLESDNLFMLCPCTGVKYNLLNGYPQKKADTDKEKNTNYPMLNYQVVVQGDKCYTTYSIPPRLHASLPYMVWEYCNCYYVAMGYFPLR